MFNLNLLKIELSVTQYNTNRSHRDALINPSRYLDHLPAYMIARCPYCLNPNSERLDTHSIQPWSRGYGKSAFHSYTIINYCKHFTLVEPFVHFHGIWPAEAKGLFGPEKPHVIGLLLETDMCLAVIHALPVCRIENNVFIPRYTLFLISYFSEQPEDAYNSIIEFNRRYTDEPYTPFPFATPSYDAPHWWDLQQWVSDRLLFWVDGDDPSLALKTGDPKAFPYGNINGRRFSHRFPYPIPKSYNPSSK